MPKRVTHHNQINQQAEASQLAQEFAALAWAVEGMPPPSAPAEDMFRFFGGKWAILVENASRSMRGIAIEPQMSTELTRSKSDRGMQLLSMTFAARQAIAEAARDVNKTGWGVTATALVAAEIAVAEVSRMYAVNPSSAELATIKTVDSVAAVTNLHEVSIAVGVDATANYLQLLTQTDEQNGLTESHAIDPIHHPAYLATQAAWISAGDALGVKSSAH